MLQSLTPSFIMFAATALFTALFIMPILRLRLKNDLTQFYWSGFWIFLALISAFAGGEQILKLAGIDVEKASMFYLAGLSAAYITFVVFAWFRLMWVTIWGVGTATFKKFRLVKKN